MTKSQQQHHRDLSRVGKLQQCWTVLFILFGILQLNNNVNAQTIYEGDTCTLKNGKVGICKADNECDTLANAIKKREMSKNDVINCGYHKYGELVCCPIESTDRIEVTTHPSREFLTEFLMSSSTAAPLTTTTEAFWLKVLREQQDNDTRSTTTPSTLSTTTEAFWLKVLREEEAKAASLTTTPAPSTTTTTTFAPLIIGNQQLTGNEGFIDLSQVFSQNSNNGPPGINNGNLGLGQNTQNWNNGPNAPPGNNNGNLGLGQNAQNWNNGPNAPPGINNGNLGLGQNAQNWNNGPNGPSGIGNGNLGLGQNVQNWNNGPNVPSGFGNGNLGLGQNTQNWNNGQSGNVGLGQNNRNGNQRGNQGNWGWPSNQGNAGGFSNGRNQGNFGNNGHQRGVRGPSNQGGNFGFVNSPGNSRPNRDRNVFNSANINSIEPQPPAWLPNNDVELVNPINSPSIFPTQTAQTNSPMVQWPTNPNSPNSLPNPHNNPISFVNENLKNLGMNVVKANVQEFRPQFGRQTQAHSSQQLSGSGNRPPLSNANFNPIDVVNANLEREGMDIERAMEIIDNDVNQHQQQGAGGGFFPSTTTPAPFIETFSDPFAPFNFRPSPNDDTDFLNDNSIDSGRGGGGGGAAVFNSGSRNIQFPTFSPESSSSATPVVAPVTMSTKRKAEIACERIEKNLAPALTEHILGGVVADLEEFPHMVALGYPSLSSNEPDFRCGGTLIDTRYVLTAAHCVNNVRSQPVVARMGVVDFNDAKQMDQVQEIPIQRIIIHDDYSGAQKYNDIAIIELAQDIKINQATAPCCLYNVPSNPPDDAKLYVTGWGTINTTTRATSQVLLKAQLHTYPLDSCNSTYAEFGLSRQISRGIIDTQICAFDPEGRRDACQGDSGGPLIMIVDEALKYFRLVGVISTGQGCGSAVPGIYTRISSYLDWIESVVWPS